MKFSELLYLGRREKQGFCLQEEQTLGGDLRGGVVFQALLTASSLLEVLFLYYYFS